MRSDTRRGSALARRLAVALAACAVAVGLAAAGAAADGDPRYLPEPEQQAWAQQLAEAQQDVDSARARVERLEAAYAEAQHSGHPRGEARAELEKNLARARRDLEEAREAMPRLVEEARRAGVYPQVLRPYKDW